MQVIIIATLPLKIPSAIRIIAGIIRRKKINPKLKLPSNCSPHVFFSNIVDSFSALKSNIMDPNVAVVRYNSDLLLSRKLNPNSTDSLVVYLSDYYENGEIWDSVNGRKVKINQQPKIYVKQNVKNP